MRGDAGSGLHELVQDAVRVEVGGMFEELRRFFDRRIAELSTEILATLHMVDVNETQLAYQLQQIHGEISRVMALPSVATRNSGCRGRIEFINHSASEDLPMPASPVRKTSLPPPPSMFSKCSSSRFISRSRPTKL